MNTSAPIFVGIAGPSGSGKSTASRALLNHFPTLGRFKFDDFFCDEADVGRHPLGYAYWDHPESIKWDAMVAAVDSLKQGRVTEVPHYKRALNRQDGTKLIEPAPVMLIDGYQVLYDDRLRELLDVKLYFDLPEHLQIIRRTERQPDVDRGYLYHVMIPAARAYLWPTRIHADHVINADQSKQAVFEQCCSILAPYFAKISTIDRELV